MPRAAQARTGTSTTRRAVVEVADHLVAGHERERHDRLEVAAGVAVDRGQVAAADAGEAGPDAHPAGPGELGRVDVLERSGPTGRARALAPAGRPPPPAA